MTAIEVQNRLNPAQRRAVNPTASVWVTASAGTGKTRVLASRVARLLLDGCKPHRILALTFTNAAAAEMADRVSKTLADWAVMDERTLSDVLNDLTGEVTTKERIDAARRCFARVLDDPIGLRAHTIHGFCQSLLRRFPVEAEVPPHFSLIDDRTKSELLELACEAVIGARGGGPETFGSEDAETLADVMDLDRALGLAVALMREQRKVAALPDDRILLGQAYAALLDIDPFETEASILEAACNDEAFDRAGLARLAEHLISGGARATGRGGLLQAWLSWPDDVRAAAFADHEKIFSLTSNWLISNKLHEAWPEARSVMDQERERVIAVRERANRAALARISTALSLFVKALDREYARLKRRRASLDYDDLIHEATQLLTRVRARAWVLYKLDGGLDHILVDEAQDNSRPQWDIFRAIAEELVAGKGSEATPAGATGRSLFVVGDPKQSIYRFQGAAPDAFADTRRWINDQLADAPPAERLDPVNLTTSFRSAEPILTFVDEVLADEDMPDGAFHDPSPHEAHEGAHKPGLVEIWPLLRAAPKVELEPWPLPDRYDRTAGTEERLAIALAGKIAALTKHPDAPVAPADILVLVRKRSGFVSAFINALKTKDVPVEGADRLSLAEELAVRDLLVLGDFLLQRDDDLALATILRGPLVNLSEKALFDLAHDRGESRLWDRLVDRAPGDQRFGPARDYLAGLLAEVDFVTPYRFLSHVLSAPCPADGLSGRRALANRLGQPIHDPLDELLSQALVFEAAHPPLLQEFLHWLRVTDEALKRSVGENPGGLRVMTIHGAKGLEANTVFVVDIDSKPPPTTVLYWFDGPEGPLPLLRPVQDMGCALINQRHADWLAAEKAEQMRLLYVALTRAERRLFICGTGPADEDKDKAERWFHFCQRAMERLAPTHQAPFEAEEDPDWSGTLERYVLRPELFPKAGPTNAMEPAPDDGHWSRRRVETEAPIRLVRPSRDLTGEEAEPATLSPLSADGSARFRRGRLIHTLLEQLPIIDAARRREAGEAFLSQPIHDLSVEQIEAYVSEALAVIDDPEFGAIFTSDALVEAPIVGQVGNTMVNGQIDRLVIGDREILIVDFKTNRPPPESVEAVAPLYLRQMAGYRAVLGQIYPDREVRCALLWTAEPRLMLLPTDLLKTVVGN